MLGAKGAAQMYVEFLQEEVAVVVEELAVVGTSCAVGHLDLVKTGAFLQRKLEIQTTRVADWQTGRSFSNPSHVLKFHCNRTFTRVYFNFDELANSNDFFQSVFILSSESYSISPLG